MEQNWIKGAIRRPGQLHKDLGVPMGKTIPVEKIDAAIRKGGAVARRARLAKTLRKMNH